MKPFSESCVQNCTPILNVIQPLLKSTKHLLEIGSGTGQHAVYFAPKMPHLIWHTSDVEINHLGINAWLEESGSENVFAPISLDVCNQQSWSNVSDIDSVFSANTLHIMSKQHVECFFLGVAKILASGGMLIVYGPFNYEGSYTSESNKNFDVWLNSQNTLSAIRDSEWLDVLAEQGGMKRTHDIEMPANNRIIVWHKL